MNDKSKKDKNSKNLKKKISFSQIFSLIYYYY